MKKDTNKLKRISIIDFFDYLERASKGYWCNFETKERVVLYEFREYIFKYQVLDLFLCALSGLVAILIPSVFMFQVELSMFDVQLLPILGITQDTQRILVFVFAAVIYFFLYFLQDRLVVKLVYYKMEKWVYSTRYKDRENALSLFVFFVKYAESKKQPSSQKLITLLNLGKDINNRKEEESFSKTIDFLKQNSAG